MATKLFKHSVFYPLCILAAALACGAANAETLTWRYNTYDGDTGQKTTPGRIELSTDGTENTFRYFLQLASVCYPAGKVHAEVERDEKTITITPEPRMRGCEVRRFVIAADGSGGRMEVKNGKVWTPVVEDRGLTLIP